MILALSSAIFDSKYLLALMLISIKFDPTCFEATLGQHSSKFCAHFDTVSEREKILPEVFDIHSKTLSSSRSRAYSNLSLFGPEHALFKTFAL